MCKIYTHLFTGGLSFIVSNFVLSLFNCLLREKAQFEVFNEKWDLREQTYQALKHKSSAAAAAVELAGGNEGFKNNVVEYVIHLQQRCGLWFQSAADDENMWGSVVRPNETLANTDIVPLRSCHSTRATKL